MSIWPAVTVAALAASLVLCWRLIVALRNAQASGQELAALASERGAQLMAVASLLGGNTYGSGITLRWHVQRVRLLARLLTEEAGPLLERHPEIAWQLRALDDYLQGVAVAASGEPLLDVRLQLDRPGYAYEETYMPLAAHIQHADP